MLITLWNISTIQDLWFFKVLSQYDHQWHLTWERTFPKDQNVERFGQYCKGGGRLQRRHPRFECLTLLKSNFRLSSPSLLLLSRVISQKGYYEVFLKFPPKSPLEVKYNRGMLPYPKDALCYCHIGSFNKGTCFY